MNTSNVEQGSEMRAAAELGSEVKNAVEACGEKEVVGTIFENIDRHWVSDLLTSDDLQAQSPSTKLYKGPTEDRDSQDPRIAKQDKMRCQLKVENNVSPNPCASILNY